jgi:glutaredoxin 3
MFEIPSAGVIIITKEHCSFCEKLQVFLDGEQIVYKKIKCDEFIKTAASRDTFLQFISAKTGKDWKTFPIVFVDGKFIGGFNDTKRWISQRITF